MIALVAIATAVALGVGSAMPPRSQDSDDEAQLLEPGPIEPSEDAESAEQEPTETPPAAPPPPSGPQPGSYVSSRTLVAGPPRIVEDLSYDEVMKVAEEMGKPSRRPTVKLAAAIGLAGLLFAGVLAAAAKGFDTVFGPLFKIFK